MYSSVPVRVLDPGTILLDPGTILTMRIPVGLVHLYSHVEHFFAPEYFLEYFLAPMRCHRLWAPSGLLCTQAPILVHAGAHSSGTRCVQAPGVHPRARMCAERIHRGGSQNIPDIGANIRDIWVNIRDISFRAHGGANATRQRTSRAHRVQGGQRESERWAPACTTGRSVPTTYAKA